uniref:Uncharacterized protein n=1 Tax=Panagrolaimus sp. ES5 TaxID=591445 RepID=A0AC34FZU1_9BILA
MATKDYCLSAKTDIIYGEPLTDQYSNLNLNQNYQSLYADNEGSKIIVTNSRKGQNYDDLKAKKDLWNKSSKELSSHLLNFNQESKEQNELKKLKDLNNSTLSLHIAAYENSNEDSDGGETESFKSKNQKTTLNKKWKTSKQAFNSSSLFDQNLFELPRQQKDQSSNNPEVMQFKASQRLRNPNDENTAPSSFVQSNRPQNKA